MLISSFKLVVIMLFMGLSALPLAAQTVQIGGDMTPNTVVCLNNSTGATSVVQVQQGGMADCNTLPKSQGDAISIIVSGTASSGSVPGSQCGEMCDSPTDCAAGLQCYCGDEACTFGICDDDGVQGCPPPNGGAGGLCGDMCSSDADCDPSLAGCFCGDAACSFGICDDDGFEGCPAPPPPASLQLKQ